MPPFKSESYTLSVKEGKLDNLKDVKTSGEYHTPQDMDLLMYSAEMGHWMPCSLVQLKEVLDYLGSGGGGGGGGSGGGEGGGEGGGGGSGITATIDYDFRLASRLTTQTSDTLQFPGDRSATLLGATSPTGQTDAQGPTNQDGLRTTTGSYVQFDSSIPIATDSTIELYFACETLGSFAGLFANWDGNTPSWTDSNLHALTIQRFSTSNYLHIYSRHSGGGTFRRTENEVLTDGTSPLDFIHVVWVNDANGSVLYVNNVAQTLVDINPGYTETNTRLGTGYNNSVIGRSPFGDTGVEYTRFVRYYNSVLTSTQVASLYTNRDS